MSETTSLRTPYARHWRHRTLARVRRAWHLLTWVVAQATRLDVPASSITNLLDTGHNADEIDSLTAIAPVNTALPTISGTTTVGDTLTAANGTWGTGGAAVAFTYQWLRDGAAIAGATADTYVLQAADQTHLISVTVTGTNTAGASSATSAQTAAIA